MLQMNPVCSGVFLSNIIPNRDTKEMLLDNNLTLALNLVLSIRTVTTFLATVTRH